MNLQPLGYYGTLNNILSYTRDFNWFLVWNTFEYGADPPDGYWSLPMELSQDELHVEEGQSPQEQHHDVRDKEGT